MEEELNLPKHIAIIMDGNRRWAKDHNQEPTAGHRKGAKVLEDIVRYANKIGIKHLSVYAFSTENWKRTKEEVGALMLLLQNYLDDFAKRIDTENIKINVLGDVSALSKGMQKSIYESQERTKNNTGIIFNIAFNYGGRAEIIKVVKELAQKAKNNEIEAEDIDEEEIEKYLYTKNQPDVDLLIRTSGEMRVSGFLLWQAAYAEYIFLEKNWPDFTQSDLEECIDTYQKRNRKFGGA